MTKNKEIRRKLKMRVYSMAYYRRNLKKCRASCDKFEKKYLVSWGGFIPLETNCEICGKQLYFNSGNTHKSIHFDHKDDKPKPIKTYTPNQWLRKHKRTPEREAMWLECDWGHLCSTCNRSLPTKNRERFVNRLNRYVFGKEIT